MPAPVGPEVSVIVRVHCDAGGILRCLDALSAQVEAPTFEVVVLDSGCTEGVKAAVAGHPLAPRVVAHAPHASLAARKADVAVAVASGSVLAFTEANCLPERTWLQQGVAACLQAEAAAGRVRCAVSARPSPWEVWDNAHYLDQAAQFGEGLTTTASLFVRLEVMARVNESDLALPPSGEFSWGKRATAAGVALVSASDSVVIRRPRTTARETWYLHRQLGAERRALARRGSQLASPRHEPFLRPSLHDVVTSALELGLPVQRGSLLAVHTLVVTARWVGWLTGRDA